MNTPTTLFGTSFSRLRIPAGRPADVPLKASGPAIHRRFELQGRSCALEPLESRRLLASVAWTGGAGDNQWTTPGNWSSGAVPTSVDDVTVDVAGNPTIVFNGASGPVSVHSLFSRENVTFQLNTFNVGTTSTFDSGAVAHLQGAQLNGGTWNFTGTGSSMALTSSGGTLNNVQLQTDLVLGNAASVTFTGTTRFNTATLRGGNSTINLIDGYTLRDTILTDGSATGTRYIRVAVGPPQGTSTIADTGVIRLASGTGGDLSFAQNGFATLINNGLISAEAAGRTLSINTENLVNNSSLSVTSGTLNVNSTNFSNAAGATMTANGASTTLSITPYQWTDTGSITMNGASLLLAGTINGFNTAGFNRSGGTVTLAGGLVNSGTFALSASTGSWTINNGSISGGTVTFADGVTLLFAGVFGGGLYNVAVQGDLILGANAVATVGGSTTFTSARLTGGGANLRLFDGYHLVNPVIAEGAATGLRSVSLAGSDGTARTIDPTGSIHLAAGCAGGLNIAGNIGSEILVNNGTISSEAAGQTLTIQSSVRQFTNNATITSSGGTLNVSSNTLANTVSGVLSVAGANSTLSISVPTWTNNGAVTVTDGTLNLGGTFGIFNLAGFTNSGGTVNLSGTFNNSGVLALNAATGSWRLFGGTIVGGSLTFADGSTLVYTNVGGALNNVAVGGEIDLGVGMVVSVLGTTTFSTARLTGNGANLRVGAGVTISTPVIAEGAGTGTRTVTLGFDTAGNVTIAPTGSIVLASGAGGGLTIANSSATNLINNGVIDAEAAGQTLRISNSRLTNSAAGSITAGQSTILTIVPTNWTNAGTLAVTDTALTLGGNIVSFNLTGFTRSGGTVNLTGALTNSGTIALNAATGTWILLGGSIIGGSLTFADGSTLVYTNAGGTLNGVAVAGEIVLDAGMSVRVQGSTTFSAARLIGAGATLNIAPGYTLTNPVSAEGAATGARVLNLVGGAGAVTIAAAGVVRLAADSGGGLNLTNTANATLVNNGLISAEAAGQTLSISNAVLTNNATTQVLSGTMVVTSTTASNTGTGTLTATGTDSTLTLTPQNLSNAGALNLTDATLTLGGTFGTFNFPSFVRSGGTVNLAGTYNNPGTLALNAATGSWRLLGGTINNGSLNFAGGSSLIYTSAGGTLNNLTVGSEIVLDTNTAVRIQGTTVFSGARLIGGGAALSFAPGYTLNTFVSAEGAATGTRLISLAAGAAGTVTIGPSGVIRLAPSSGGGLTLGNAATATLVNNGLISAEATGQALTINNSTFTNSATLQSVSGTLAITATITNVAASSLTGGVWRAAGGTIVTSAALARIAAGTTVELGSGGVWNATNGLGTNNGTFRLLGGRGFTTVTGFTNNGVFQLSAGSNLGVTGMFVQGGNGSLRTTIASADSLGGYGRVTATGTATIAGSLVATFDAAYGPQVGDVFTIVGASNVIGMFAAVTLPSVAANRKIAVLMPGNAVQLLFTHIADFNNDGVLNADDLSDFITGYFNSPADSATDFNHDGIINADDLSDFIVAFFG